MKKLKTLLLIALFGYNENIRISVRNRLLIGAFLLLSYVGLFTVVYALGNTVGNGTIFGMQGRYFYPLLPIWLLLIYNKRIRLKLDIAKWKKYAVAFVFFSISFLITINYMYKFYYKPD